MISGVVIEKDGVSVKREKKKKILKSINIDSTRLGNLQLYPRKPPEKLADFFSDPVMRSIEVVDHFAPPTASGEKPAGATKRVRSRRDGNGDSIDVITQPIEPSTSAASGNF